MIRVGIVGCGKMGGIHSMLIRELKSARVVGFADQDIERAKRFCAQEDADFAAKDLETLLLQAKPDAVHILTPPTTHPSLAEIALRSGCHVYVEKPMALTLQDARLMRDAAVRHDRLLTVGHNHLFDTAVREAHRRFNSGKLGEIVGMNVFHNSLPNFPPWVPRLPSGPWVNDVDHLLYLSRSFMGDAQIVRAVGVPAIDHARIAEVHIAMKNTRGWSSLTYSTSTAPFQIRMSLFGTRRTLEVDLISGILVEHRHFDTHRWLRKGFAALDVASQLTFHAGRNALRVLSGRERGWSGLRRLLEAFYSAIDSGSPSPVPTEQCLRIVEIKENIQSMLQSQSGNSC